MDKYLARYACPEISLAASISTSYEAVLVVPAYCESRDFLNQYFAAVRSAGGKILCIVIVNAAAPQHESSWSQNDELLQWLVGSASRKISDCPPAWWGPVQLSSAEIVESVDVLVVDRASEKHALPEGEGVGLARKIGCDIAVQMWALGRFNQPWIYCTDADATLPAGFFQWRNETGNEASARLMPFAHVPGNEGHLVDEATALYEVQLRYYVLSLASAGSPYCYHSIGSTIAIHMGAYCAVRGFPRRLAGEDFHLLNKLAKVGSIVSQWPTAKWPDLGEPSVQGGAIALSSRLSSRTIHGTGVAVAKLLENGPGAREHGFYHPEIFRQLGVWLRCLNAFSLRRDVEAMRRQVAALGQRGLEEALEQLGTWRALQTAASATQSRRALLRRGHEWFDALKTLRLVHLLESQNLAAVPWREALARSSWCSVPTGHASAGTISSALADLERRRPAAQGLEPYLNRQTRA